MKLNDIREYIKKVLLEADDFGCNKHSLGYIDAEGNFIDLRRAGIEHEHYLDIAGYSQEPEGWIKISNANELWLQKENWFQVTDQQIDGLIDMWIACSRFSNWIKRDIEGFYVLFGSNTTGQMQEITIPDFLEAYGNPDHMDRLFDKLLN